MFYKKFPSTSDAECLIPLWPCYWQEIWPWGLIFHIHSRISYQNVGFVWSIESSNKAHILKAWILLLSLILLSRKHKLKSCYTMWFHYHNILFLQSLMQWSQPSIEKYLKVWKNNYFLEIYLLRYFVILTKI